MFSEINSVHENGLYLGCAGDKSRCGKKSTPFLRRKELILATLGMGVLVDRSCWDFKEGDLEGWRRIFQRASRRDIISEPGFYFHRCAECGGCEVRVWKKRGFRLDFNPSHPSSPWNDGENLIEETARTSRIFRETLYVLILKGEEGIVRNTIRHETATIAHTAESTSLPAKHFYLKFGRC